MSEKSKISKLRGVLKKISKAPGSAVGTLYGKVKYGWNYDRPSKKMIEKYAVKQMRKDNRGGIGAEEYAKELYKRKKILEKKFLKK